MVTISQQQVMKVFLSQVQPNSSLFVTAILKQMIMVFISMEYQMEQLLSLTTRATITTEAYIFTILEVRQWETTRATTITTMVSI